MSSADHPLIRMLAGFEARVLDLTSALAQSSTAGDARQPRTSETRAMALRIAACRRLWFS